MNFQGSNFLEVLLNPVVYSWASLFVPESGKQRDWPLSYAQWLHRWSSLMSWRLTYVNDGDGRVLSADDNKRQHGAELVHLSLGNVMLRVWRQSGVVNKTHGWVSVEEQSQVMGRITLTFSANPECLESTKQQRRVVRRLKQQPHRHSYRNSNSSNNNNKNYIHFSGTGVSPHADLRPHVARFHERRISSVTFTTKICSFVV